MNTMYLDQEVVPHDLSWRVRALWRVNSSTCTFYLVSTLYPGLDGTSLSPTLPNQIFEA